MVRRYSRPPESIRVSYSREDYYSWIAPLLGLIHHLGIAWKTSHLQILREICISLVSPPLSMAPSRHRITYGRRRYRLETRNRFPPAPRHTTRITAFLPNELFKPISRLPVAVDSTVNVFRTVSRLHRGSYESQADVTSLQMTVSAISGIWHLS